MRFILEIMKRLNDLTFLLANKADKNHSHDISNISGLQHLLSQRTTHTALDTKQLKDLIHFETQPRFILKFESTATSATVTAFLVSMNGYYMKGILLNIQYQKVFDGKWIRVPEIIYDGSREYTITIDGLEPNASYHVELTIRDIHNPMLSIAVSDMFRTGVAPND